MFPGTFERHKRKLPDLVRKVERQGAAAQQTVAFFPFLSIEAFAVKWFVPNTTGTPHHAENPQKPERREWLFDTQCACRSCSALNTGQNLENRQSFNAVRALVVPPERGQGTETGKYLIQP